MNTIELAEQAVLPDWLIRFGIRNLCRKRLKDEFITEPERQEERFQTLIEKLRQSPIAIETDAANEQHYEVPSRFYELTLGKNLKYSGCNWPQTIDTLEQAEAFTLDLYCKRAELQDGMNILELGCGWGSLTIWMARKYPNALITGVSNSNSQREHILNRAQQAGLSNIVIITSDVNQLALNDKFDRCISIEMFEHMRNYQSLLQHINSWLKPSGKLFVQVFCHRILMYPFEINGEDNWMGKHFFTGGLMPSTDTLLHFQDDLTLETRWLVNGSGYEKTANAWLDNLDKNYTEIVDIFAQTYSPDDAKLWVQRWRMFFMACAELFGYKNGSEWCVAHFRFAKNHNRMFDTST